MFEILITFENKYFDFTIKFEDDFKLFTQKARSSYFKPM